MPRPSGDEESSPAQPSPGSRPTRSASAPSLPTSWRPTTSASVAVIVDASFDSLDSYASASVGPDGSSPGRNRFSTFQVATTTMAHLLGAGASMRSC